MLLHLLTNLTDYAALRTAGEAARDVIAAASLGKKVRRSSRWPSVRELFLRDHPNCAACGSGLHLNVHHKQPFHLFPALELDPTNLITLCEHGPAGMNCHCVLGHGGHWEDWNKNVVRDVRRFFTMLGGIMQGSIHNPGE